MPSDSFWRMKANPAIYGGGSTPTIKAHVALEDEDGWPPVAGTNMWT